MHVLSLDKPCQTSYIIKIYDLILGPPEKPINVVIHEKTQNSITVGWKAGLNGGYPQHFKVFYREKGKKIWKESQDSISGLKTGESINYTISDLYAANEYEITVVAINQFMGRTVSQAAVQMVIFGGKVPVLLSSASHI